GPCSVTPAAAGTWTTHPVWQYLQAASFASFKSLNPTLFAPAASILDAASEVCVVKDVEFAYAAGSVQTFDAVPVGTVAVIFAVQDSVGQVPAAAVSTVTTVAATSTPLTLAMLPVQINIAGLSAPTSGGNATLNFLADAPQLRAGSCSPISL